jgi:serine/threonine-protein kinase
MAVDIPGYIIIAELHRSPLTRVYRARHQKLEREVLIKILREEFCNDPEVTARFLREARTCARLEHENVVKIYDYGERHGVPFLVLEFVEGKDLKQLLEERAPLPMEEALRLFADLLRGLGHAHRLGILHRDIKPANLLVSENGRLKISDFGLATFADTQEVTQTGAIVGTPAYMAPEQVKGERLCEKTDLYAAGLVFYEMLTGIQPFRGSTLPETVNRVLNVEPEPPRRYRPEIPPHLNELCLQLLAKDPALRPQSASAVLDLLQSHGPAESINVRETSPPGRQRIYPIFAVGAVFVAAAIALWFLFKGNGGMQEGKTGLPAAASSERKLPENIQPGPDQRTLHATRPDSGQEEVAKQGSAPSSVMVSPPEKRAEPVHGVTSLPEESEKNAQKGKPESPAVALLRLDCLPWARVIVDGQEVGVTPFDSALHLPPGTHTIQLVNPRFPEFTDTLELFPGQEITFSVNLMQEYGGVFVLVRPWADVFINGKRVETTPMKEPIWLEPGLHTVRLVNPAFPPRSIPVRVRKGRIDTLRVRF